LHWDVLRQWQEIQNAIRAASQKHGTLASIGVDTWGVDFGLLGRGDVLLGNPHHYRDPRTNGMLEETFRRVPREEIFRQTGIQFMQLNTLYQLLAMRLQNSPLLDIAETFLMMPDLVNFFLTGQKVCEFSDATTTQFYNPQSAIRNLQSLPGGWAMDLLRRLDIPTHFLPNVVPPGTSLGNLRATVAEDCGLMEQLPQVIAPASHDTGSAVAAVPAQGEDWCYISSGTWSLMGVEMRAPLITDRTLELNFTNEGGVGGTFRFLKNIMGLWLVQESRRTWQRAAEDLSYDELTRLAANAPAFVSIIEPDHPSFLMPGDMPSRIRAFCEKTGQTPPQDKGALVRCCLESLALKYRWVLERLEELFNRRLAVIHIIGGGSQNRLLNQFTADATQRTVLTGPVEATAIGNVMVQALALGYVSSHAELREVVRRSFEMQIYEPQPSTAWDEAYGRYLKIVEQAKRF
jgi:rhamnulokinase